MEINKILNCDCLLGMNDISSKSIDTILCDLPYGITRNQWDSIIPLEPLWAEYERIIKDNGAIILFGSGVFTAQLINSNLKLWRYELIWQKTTKTGFLNAKKMPLRSHENIEIFYKKLPTYNPQKTAGHTPVHSYTKHTTDGTNYGKTKIGISGSGSTERFPTSILAFPSDKQKSALHPTQKPIALLEYLIRTYSNEGDVVLDNAIGSGSTAIACINTKRNYIGFETDENHYKTAQNRILERLKTA